MPESTYNFIELVEQDMQLEDGRAIHYRAELRVSFRYHGGES